MKIAFDLDGVLTNCWTQQVYNEEVINRDESSDFYEFWQTKFHTFSEMKQQFYMEQPFLYTRQNITKNIKDLLNRLAKEHDIFYITCRPAAVHSATTIWLNKQGVPSPENLLYSTSDKVAEVRTYDIDYLVEDTLKIAKAVKPFCQVILMEKFYNDLPEREEFIHIKHLGEVETILC